MFFSFPPDARWESERCCVIFGVEVGEYEGVVRVPRRVFQALLDESPTPQRCLEAYYLHRIRLELIAERKVRRRQLTDDGNIEITGRVNAGEKMHRRTEVIMHRDGPPAGAQLSSSIDEPAFPSRPGGRWPRRAA